MKNAEAAISSRRGGVKSLSNGEEGELKTFKTEGGGLLLLGGGGQYLITCHENET